MDWLIAHASKIGTLVGELIAALAALTTAIVGLCSIITNRLIPILTKDHPALPMVKVLGSIGNALNNTTVSDADRPTTPPSNPVPPAAGIVILIILLSLGACSTAKAQTVPVSIFDGLVANQGVLYLTKDHKVKNLTTFQILTTNHIDSWGKWGQVLWDGDSVHLGISYDDLNSIDGGAVVFAKDINALLAQLPVTFPLKDTVHLTAYVAGDCASWVDGKMNNQFCAGGAYLKGEIKFK